MIRAYDDYGNVVDIVEWEKQIRADAIDEMVEFFATKSICVNEECIHMNDSCSCVKCIAEQLKDSK